MDICFVGYSDDIVDIGVIKDDGELSFSTHELEGIDEYGAFSLNDKSINALFEILQPDGTGCYVAAMYGIVNATWSFSVMLFDEDIPLPENWNYEFKIGGRNYSSNLIIRNVQKGSVIRPIDF